MRRFHPEPALAVGIFRFRFLAIGLAVVAIGSLAAGGAWAKDEPNPPRYALKVGQQLEYRGYQAADEKEGIPGGEINRLRCWVVAQQPDKSWRLLFQFCDRPMKKWRATMRTKMPSTAGSICRPTDGSSGAGKCSACSPSVIFLACPTRP